MMTDIYCTLDAVSIRRGAQEVLNGVSVSLRRGECLLVRGANGCGKSTLLRYIAGLDGSNEPRTHTNRVGYIGHTLALKESMTCMQSIDFYAYFSEFTYKKREVLPVFECHTFSHTKVKHCSAGQRQRIALTRLVFEAWDVWLLDEPTTALDRAGVETFQRVVETCRARGCAFIIATHANLDIPGSRTLTLDAYRV